MKRWQHSEMSSIAKALFKKIHRRKHSCHHNHDIHFLAREIETWLNVGVESLRDGSYIPAHVKRYYFADEVVDQLEIKDRIFQHVLLKQLKPTFKHVTNKHCYHLHGPSGVKYATQTIRDALQKQVCQYFIRVDIKSFYRSIPHYRDWALWWARSLDRLSYHSILQQFIEAC